jgi:RHH-type transcriptional regulator, rel operon repressor / antitoxin RelB
MKQINVRVSDALSARLDSLAARTGRSKTFYAVEALEEHLEEYEDYYLAKDALADFRQSDDAAIDLADLAWPE